MLKSWMRDITLAVQARSGFTPALLFWAGVVVTASLTTFAFLCVAAYGWLSPQFGAVVGGLIMAGAAAAVAVVGAVISAVARRRAKQRAMLERAARAQGASWLDPKILGVALQTARSLGWERIIPVALLGILAAQWARENRERKSDEAGEPR